jgi:hypothetical protein
MKKMIVALFFSALLAFSQQPAQILIRNATDTGSLRVGIGAEGATILHVPVRIQGTGTGVVEPVADNSANPTAKIPILPCRANAVAPTWTEGNLVPCSVDLAGSNRVIVINFPDNEPFNLAQVGGSPVVTGGVAGLLAVAGNIAHDAADGGFPLKTGFRAINPDVSVGIANGDRHDDFGTRTGSRIVLGSVLPIQMIEFVWTAAKTNATIISAGLLQYIHLSQVAVTCDNANSVAVGVRIGFSSTTLPATPGDGGTADGMVVTHPGIPAGSGIVQGTGAGLVAAGTADEDLLITASVPTGGSCRAFFTYALFP